MAVIKTSESFVVGTKQTLKAIREQRAQRCFVAKDADEHIISEIVQMCNNNGIKIIYLDTMRELGHIFKINVGAASAVELK